jgi:hypothetical protein
MMLMLMILMTVLVFIDQNKRLQLESVSMTEFHLRTGPSMMGAFPRNHPQKTVRKRMFAAI